MNTDMLLGLLFAVAGVVLIIVGGWFGVLLGIIALLAAVMLLMRGYRKRSSPA